MNRDGRLWFMTDVDLHEHEKWLAVEADLADATQYALAFSAFQYLCGWAKRHHPDGVFSSELEMGRALRGLPLEHVAVLRRHSVISNLAIINFAEWNERAKKDVVNGDRAERRVASGQQSGQRPGEMTGEVSGQLTGELTAATRSEAPSSSASASSSAPGSDSPSKPSEHAPFATIPKHRATLEPADVEAAVRHVERVTGRRWTPGPGTRLLDRLRQDVRVHGLEAVMRAMDSLGTLTQPEQAVLGASNALNPIPSTRGQRARAAGAAQDREAVRDAFSGR